MTPDKDNLAQLDKLLKLAAPIIFLVCVLLIVTAYRTGQNTGILVVAASDPNTTISVTQNGKQAEAIGTGYVKVRLKPGSYLVGGFSGSKQGSEVVLVKQHQTTNSSIKISDLA